MPHSVECIRYAQNPYSVYELIAITLCSAMYAIEATMGTEFSLAQRNSTQGNTTLLHVITSIVLLI